MIDLVPVDGELGAKAARRRLRRAATWITSACGSSRSIRAVIAHLIKHGVVPGEIKRRYGADGYGPSLYITDPEGNVVELKGSPGQQLPVYTPDTNPPSGGNRSETSVGYHSVRHNRCTGAAMDTRKFLLVALVVAGAVISAGRAHAQFATVFVPELAVIDGALCRPSEGGLPLVRLAQAVHDKPQKKTEISPAAPAAAKAASAAAPDDDPALMRAWARAIKVTTSSKLAQQYFDKGYRLAWGFNHDEALRAFRKAQRLDPQCAMCFWGEAWALGPNINVPMDAKANAPRWQRSKRRSASRRVHRHASRR